MICLTLFLSIGAEAQKSNQGDTLLITDVHIDRENDQFYISMNIDPSELKIKQNREAVFTPKLIGEGHELDLTTFSFAGRNRWFSHLRNDKGTESLKHIHQIKDKEKIHYQASVAFEPWMSDASLMILDSRCGCLNKVKSEKTDTLTTWSDRKFIPQYINIVPQIEVKSREVKGSAYIDFPVNLIDIHEDYRNNRQEFEKIYATIDSLAADPDARIIKVTFKGYASPEGTYQNNTRLAKGRTETLMEHVKDLYNFPADVVEYDYEPEDWEGLRNYVQKSHLTYKKEILQLIDSNEEPDRKENLIKTRYRQDYDFLLAHVYPGLRHSDYTVKYTIRAYTDIEEAKRVMKVRPGNLSLHEFYLVAKSYEEGSEEYNETFTTMVHVYPQDEIAKLNAANVAMKRGDIVSARKYLEMQSNRAELIYAKANLMALEGDYENALELFINALDKGIHESEQAIEQIQELLKVDIHF